MNDASAGEAALLLQTTNVLMSLQAFVEGAVDLCDKTLHSLRVPMPPQQLPNRDTPKAKFEQNLRDALNKFHEWLQIQDDNDFKVDGDDQHVRVLVKENSFAHITLPVLKAMGLNKVRLQL